MRLKLFLLLIISIACINAVPEIPNRKCDESGFCRRCRRPQNQQYELKMDTLTTFDAGINIDLVNNVTSVVLNLKLECLESNTFHYEIDEKTPLKPRYRAAREILLSTPRQQSVTVSTTASTVEVTCGINKAMIHNDPFVIEFYQSGVRVVSINRQKLMRFEHLRTKPQVVEEDDGEWEETWEGYTDSKPNGPEAIAIDFTFDESDVLFGIPEHHDALALKSTLFGEPYRLFTIDNTFFELESRRPNYGVVPVIYGHGASSGQTVGVYWQNTADTYVDVYDGKTSHFISEAGIMDVYVFLGPSPNDAFAQYTKITGVAGLPQLYTLAYHQSRWSYYTQAEVLEKVEKFDTYDIPLDTMWLDVDYTDGKRYFTWNYTAFPSPLEMMSTLNSTGRHLVHIIDPHIKVDPDYFFYKENKENNFFVKTRNGTDLEGLCWPGLSSYVDFFNPMALSNYADQYSVEKFKDNVIEMGVWNDMNEPVIFDVPEKTFPRDSIHFGNIEHRLVHNAYGYMQTKGTFDGLIRRSGGKQRPFILTRSFFAGSQRYTAVWTGDNTAEWGYLKASVHACLAIAVAGISFCGSDIGGFFGNPEEELFIRWTQAAAFQPFFRNHASAGTKYREPWMFSEQALTIARDSIRKRYQLLPFWYTLFYEHEMSGKPVMRPMLSQYPRDRNVLKLETQYMLGDNLLVSPVLDRSATWVIVYFPSIDGSDKNGELWYDIDTYQRYDEVGTVGIKAPIDKIPVFQRGGSIISKKLTVRKSSFYMRDDLFSLFVALDKNKRAEGTLYYDDETSYDYKEKELYDYLHFSFINDTLAVHPMKENFKKIQFERIYFAGVEPTPTKASIFCGNDRVTTNLEIVNEENSIYVDIQGVSCDYTWTITVEKNSSTSTTVDTDTPTSTTEATTPSGSSRNILGSTLLAVNSMIYAVKYFL